MHEELTIDKRVSLVAAMARNRVIGRDNGIPWRVPGELKRFKALTLGKLLLLGRQTFEAIGKPLPGRDTMILTSQKGYEAPGCRVVHSLTLAVEAINADPRPEVMIGGGEQIYRLFLPYADRVYLTVIELEILDGDTFFPLLPDGEFEVIEEEPVDGPVPYTYFTYTRIAAPATRPSSAR